MYALLPILAFLATANALPVAVNNEVAAVEKRACLFGVVCLDSGSTSSSSSSAKASSTSTSASSSSSSSSSATKTSTTSASASATGNVVQSVVAVPSQVVSAVLKCPLDPLGVLGLCQDANTGASTSASASKASTTASSSAAAGNVVSSIIAVPSAVVSGAVSVVNPVVSSAVAVPSAIVSGAVSVVAPVVSSAVSVVAPVVSSAVVVPSAVVSSAVSVVAPVVSSAVVVPSAIVSQAVSVVAPVVSSAVAVPSAIVSSAVSVAQPAASSVSSVVAPIVSVIVPGPAASSVSSIIASVTASSSSAAAASSSSAVTPTTTAAASSSASPSASAAPTNAAVANWGYTACVQEGTNGRALTGSTFAGSGMTVESCLASCDASGFMYAGLEYSSECYCGSALANGASVAKTGTCDMPCSGNSKQICGGSATLSLYTSTKAATAQPAALPAGWSSTTCMQEVSGRAFTKKSTASDDMTIAKCLSFCGDSKYAGIEYGRECYCADTLSNGASLASTSGQCNTPCAGAPSQTCGGPNALQVYTNGNYKTASAGAYANTGCVQEVDGRLLRGASIAGDNMTIETCTSFCQSQGMSIAGLEYARECYCGNSYVSSPLQSGQCNMPCAGNANENCGGPNALNIFTLA